MIPKIFPTINNVSVYKNKEQTVYTELRYYDTPYTVKSHGPQTKFFTFDEYNTDFVSLGDETPEWVGNAPCVRFFYGGNFPPEISEQTLNKKQFAIIYTGNFYTDTTHATLYFSGEGRVYGLVVTGLSSPNHINYYSSQNNWQLINLTEEKEWSINFASSGAHLLYLYYYSPSQSDQINNVFSVRYKESGMEKTLPLSAGVYEHPNEFGHTGTLIKNYNDISLNQSKDTTAELTFQIPIVSSTSSLGYAYDRINNCFYDPDNTNNRIKRFRMVEFFSGYQIGATVSTIMKFVGQIRDWRIVRGKTKSYAEISCQDWSCFLFDTINEGFPNICDYLTFGYTDNGVVAGHTKPRTFDAWTIEDAMECILLNANIDPQVYRAKKKYISVDDEVVEGYYLNSESNRENKTRLERNINYGDPLEITSDDSDEKYYWQFSIGDSLLDNLKEMSDNYGFGVGFNNEGKFYCKSVLNPVNSKNIDTFDYSGTWATVYDPEYLYAKSIESTDNGAKITATFVGVSSGIVFNRGAYGTVHIHVSNSTLGLVTSGSFNLAYDTSWTYFDGVDGSVGYNPAVVKIGNDFKYGSYSLNIELTNTTGVSVNALFIYDDNFTTPADTFYTGDETENSIIKDTVEIDTLGSDFRNDVVVVGKLLGVQTSLSLDEDVQVINPNNPVSNHVLARAIDKYSLSSLSYSNYVGRKLQTIIVEPKIGTAERANWLAYETVLRYNNYSKLLSPMLKTTGHPLLQIGDYVKIHDDSLNSFGTISDFWVTGIKDKYTKTAYETEIELSGFKPWNSFYQLPTPSLKEFDYNPFYDVRIYNTGLPMLKNEWLEVHPDTEASDSLLLKYINLRPEGYYLTTQRMDDLLPSVGYIQLETEIIKYESVSVGTMEKTMSGSEFNSVTCTINVGNLTRGIYYTDQVGNNFGLYAGKKVYMEYSPYLSEEEGIVPEIEFHLLFPGFVRVAVARLDSSDLDILTETKGKTGKHSGWKYLDIGKHRFAWGALDRKGTYNKENAGRYSWEDSQHPLWVPTAQYKKIITHRGGQIVYYEEDTPSNWYDFYFSDKVVAVAWGNYLSFVRWAVLLKYTTELNTQTDYSPGKDFYAQNLQRHRHGIFNFDVKFIDIFKKIKGSTKPLGIDTRITTRLHHGRAEEAIVMGHSDDLYKPLLQADIKYANDDYEKGYYLSDIRYRVASLSNSRIVNIKVIRYIFNIVYGSNNYFSEDVLSLLWPGDISGVEEPIGDDGFTLLLDNDGYTGIIPETESSFLNSESVNFIQTKSYSSFCITSYHIIKVEVTDMSGRKSYIAAGVSWIPSFLEDQEFKTLLTLDKIEGMVPFKKYNNYGKTVGVIMTRNDIIEKIGI